jgi:hypothetical protein
MGVLTPQEDDGLRRERRQFEERRLSEYATQQRRSMLLVATLTFGMSWGGIHLSEITAFGITIARWEERYFLAFLSLVLTYLIGNFESIARPEFVTWKDEIDRYALKLTTHIQASVEEIKKGSEILRGVADDPNVSPHASAFMKDGLQKIDAWLGSELLTRKRDEYIAMYRARVRFEYHVPVMIGLVALYLALGRIVTTAG